MQLSSASQIDSFAAHSGRLGLPRTPEHCQPCAIDTKTHAPDSRLTTGYETDWLRSFPGQPSAAPQALVSPPSSYVGYVTWTHTAGYQLPWNPWQPPADNAVFLLRGAQWERLGTG